MGKAKKRTALEDAILLNNATYFDYLDRVKKIALSIFEWVNLPDSMDARYLERCLYYTGAAGLLHDSTYGFINTKATCSNNLNIYGLPTEITCFSYSYRDVRRVYNGLTSTGNVDVQDKGTDIDSEAILVLNTWDMLPTANSIELFCMRLAEAQRIIDINIKAQATPFVVMTDENERLSMMNAFQQVDKNSAVIFGKKGTFEADSIKTINTQAPYVADKIQGYKRDVWNEMLTYLGVDNIEEKAERLVASEVGGNNELVNLNLMSYYAPRKKAADQFNEKYGLKGTDKEIDVKLRSDIGNLIKRVESTVVDDYFGEQQIRDVIANDITGETNGEV